MQSMETKCGIDVSAKKLEAKRRRGSNVATGEFDNDVAGHRALLKWLGKNAAVCLEATGVYHLQLALTLRAAGVKVMVINPRVAKDFGRALGNRSKTDAVDADVLLQYVERMPFVEWEAPRSTVLEVREHGRRITELVQNATDEKNRVHARTSSRLCRAVLADVAAHVRDIEKRATRIEMSAMKLIKSDSDLLEQYEILTGIRGVGRRSAILLLTELAVLDPTMTVKQLVAYAGLDPRRYESGSSVEKPPRISKAGNARLRAILYMNALSAVRHERGARLFFAQLVARGKKRKQALVAVMRKLLHGIWIVLQRRVQFDPAVLFAASLAKAESSGSAVAATQPQQGQDHRNGRSAAEELRQQLEPAPAEATRRPRRRKVA
jgi:transposase